MAKTQENGERREHTRTNQSLRVSLRMSDSMELLAVTRDVSEGGAFVLLDRDSMPAVGEMVNVQVQGHPEDDEQPWIRMQVARTASNGIGLMIVD